MTHRTRTSSRSALAPLPFRRGRRAERVARAYVVRSGMQLVARNKRVRYLEIDIVARDDDVMVVIEVRARTAGAWLGALQSVGRIKQQRLRRAAAVLWARQWHRDCSLRGVRFDVIAVDLAEDPPRIEHIRAAF